MKSRENNELMKVLKEAQLTLDKVEEQLAALVENIRSNRNIAEHILTEKNVTNDKMNSISSLFNEAFITANNTLINLIADKRENTKQIQKILNAPSTEKSNPDYLGTQTIIESLTEQAKAVEAAIAKATNELAEADKQTEALLTVAGSKVVKNNSNLNPSVDKVAQNKKDFYKIKPEEEDENLLKELEANTAAIDTFRATLPAQAPASPPNSVAEAATETEKILEGIAQLRKRLKEVIKYESEDKKEYAANQALHELEKLFTFDEKNGSATVKQPLPAETQKIYNYFYIALRTYADSTTRSANAFENISREVLNILNTDPANPTIIAYGAAKDSQDKENIISPLDADDYEYLIKKFTGTFKPRIDALVGLTAVAPFSSSHFSAVLANLDKYKESTATMKEFLYRFRENANYQLLERLNDPKAVAIQTKNAQIASQYIRHINKIEVNLQEIETAHGVRSKCLVYGKLMTGDANPTSAPAALIISTGEKKETSKWGIHDIKTTEQWNAIKIANPINFLTENGEPSKVTTTTKPDFDDAKGTYKFIIDFGAGQDLLTLLSAPRVYEDKIFNKASIPNLRIMEWSAHIIENLCGMADAKGETININMINIYQSILNSLNKTAEMQANPEAHTAQALAITYQLTEAMALYCKCAGYKYSIETPTGDLKSVAKKLNLGTTTLTGDKDYIERQIKIVENKFTAKDSNSPKILYKRGLGFSQKTIQEAELNIDNHTLKPGK